MDQRSFGKKVKPKKQIHFEDSCLDGGLVCDLKVRFNAFRLPLNSRLPCSNDGMRNIKRSTPKLYKDLKAHLGTFMRSLSKDELCDYILQLLLNSQSDVKSRTNQSCYLNESTMNSSPDGSIPNCSNDLPSKQLGPGEELSVQELVEEAFEGRTDNHSDRCLRANDQSDFHKIISAINLLCDIRSVFDQTLNGSVEPNNINESRRTKSNTPFGIDKSSKRLVVSLGDVIGKRKENITEVEAWALLCQAVQALQDLFLNGGEEEKLRAECTLNGVQLTPKGRVILGQRSRPISHPRLSDTHLEKMWIYSLGVTVRGIVSWQEASIGLKTILSRMLSPDLHSRASLMDLLDVISAYCRGRKRTKPLSHVIMDMYSQTVNHIFEGKNISPNCIKNNDDIKKIYITPNQVVKAHFARVGARLYAQPVSGDKYFGPNTLIGPEFIIRSSEPTTTILMGVGKLNIKRRVLVVLLNGKKLEVTCDASTVTFADVFQVVASKEGLELSVTLGLACLVSDDFVFPPAEFKISKVAPPNWSKPRTQFPPPFTVYLRFKLYLPSLRGTRSWKWKHLLYLQLRRALLERQLRAEKQQLLALAGLALQAEFGDHSGMDDGDSYFLAEHYVPDEESSAYELSVLHRQRAGLDPGRAEEMFISQVMALPEYGTQYTSAYMVGKEESSTEMWIGVNSKGVVLCYKRDFNVSMVREPHYIFNWPDIKKLSYSKHLFEIVSADSKYKLKLESNKSLYLFRMAWLHHKFFMKMTNEYTTLQCLTEEFGLKIKPNKSVLHVSPDNNKRTELSALRRAASLLSPDRAIFRGKTATHCGKTGRSESYREMKSPSSLPSSPPSSALSTLSYHSSNTPQLSDEVLSRGNGARRRVLMGTRAIFSNSQHDLRFSSHSDLESASPLPEAYVLNTNIRSETDKFHTDFNETISESLAEKFNEVSFSHDRILTTVKIERDSYGSFGLQVVEGRDGHAYIISTIPGTAAYKAGSIHSGDQIQAVNGKNVLSTSYTDVLKMVQNSGSSVQLILSQLSNGRRTPQEVANMAGPKMKITDSTGFDLMTVLQKPIEESYLNAIRYQIATETDDSMMTTDLPRPSYL